MYSAVLMLALTTGSEAVDFGRHGCGGSGSCGGVVYGCSGYSGCSGAVGCSGVVGCSSYVGCSSSCHSRGHARRGCSGGGLFSRHRHGCHGCSSGCSGYVGCSGVIGCAGGCGGGVIITPGSGPGMQPGEPLQMPKDKKIGALLVPATIVVSLPAGARLTVDGTPTTSTSERRTLVTPAIQVGETYVYTLRAEIVNNGQALAQSQNVTVRGGETSTVLFNFTSQNVASR